MHSIILWYNKNGKTIWLFIGIIVVMYLLMQLLSYVSKQEKETVNINNTIENKVDEQLNTIKFEEDESVISGDKLTDNQVNSARIIDEFVSYCNEKKVEEAYQLLSDDCKSKMYPTLESFKQFYYDKVFNGEIKKVSIENWTSNTYKVKFNTNSLSTGIYSEEDIIQDYITIVNDKNNNLKLNINSFLGRQETNVFQDYENIHIEVVEINTFMDYQEYTYKVANNSENDILLDNKENSYSMYIEDEKSVTYPAITHEISEAELKVSQNETKTINIKYYIKFSTTRKIKNAVFSNIQLNEEFGQNQKIGSIKIQF